MHVRVLKIQDQRTVLNRARFQPHSELKARERLDLQVVRNDEFGTIGVTEDERAREKKVMKASVCTRSTF